MSAADVGEIVAAVIATAWVVTLLRSLTGRAVHPRVLTGTGVAAAMLTLSAALSDEIVDDGRGPTALDSAVETVVLAHRTPAATAVATLLDVAVGSTALALLAALVAVALVWWGHRFQAGLVVGAAAASGVLITGLKLAYARPRPPLPLQLIPESSFSLPSGHALGSMIVLGTIAVVGWSVLRPGAARVGLAVAAGVLVVATGCSRVYLGVHWGSDVLDGWLVGGACVLLGASALAWRAPLPARTVESAA